MTRSRLAGLGLTAAVLLAACSAAGSTATTNPTAAPTQPAATAAAATSPAGGTTVSASTATTNELVSALEAAGVSNASRWAREIEEYRPYDTSDPTLQHLQDELAKYDPDPATLAGILSVLTP